MNGLKLFFIGYPIFLLIDFVWLTLMKNFYQTEFKNFGQTIQLNIVAAALAYVFLVIGLVVFVVLKNNYSYWSNFLLGGLFGLVAYGTYDLSNMATISRWSLKLTIIDMTWGFFVCGLLSLILGYVNHKYF